MVVDEDTEDRSDEKSIVMMMMGVMMFLDKLECYVNDI